MPCHLISEWISEIPGVSIYYLAYRASYSASMSDHMSARAHSAPLAACVTPAVYRDVNVSNNL